MVERKIIASITIPKYIRSIRVSEAQREKYYEWNDTTIKCGSKTILQKYINPIFKNEIIKNNGNVLPQHLRSEYVILGFKGDTIYATVWEYPNNISTIAEEEVPKRNKKKPLKYILCDFDTTKKVIANDTKAGKPREHIIKGQDFYVGLNPFIRNKLVHELKATYYNVVSKVPIDVMERVRQVIKKSYPVYIELELLDTVKNVFDNTKEGHGKRWDVGNRTDPYLKTFLDFLANGYKGEDGTMLFQPLIEDDDRLHVSSGNNSFFTPIEDEEERKLVFRIYADTRPIWKTTLK